MQLKALQGKQKTSYEQYTLRYSFLALGCSWGGSVQSGGSGPNSTPSYYSVQFHVYRLLIAPSIIDNLITKVLQQINGIIKVLTKLLRVSNWTDIVNYLMQCVKLWLFNFNNPIYCLVNCLLYRVWSINVLYSLIWMTIVRTGNPRSWLWDKNVLLTHMFVPYCFNLIVIVITRYLYAYLGLRNLR